MNEELLRKIEEKINKLQQASFSKQAVFEFFGNLSEPEIEILIELIESGRFDFSNIAQRNFLTSYLKKLLEKIKEKRMEG